MDEIASSTPHAWFASIMSTPSGPIERRISAARRSSASRSAPTFIFTCLKPSSHRLLDQRLDHRVVIAEPPSRSRIRRIAALEHRLDPRVPTAAHVPNPLECLLRGKHIVDVPEVDAADELLGREIGKEPPKRLAFGLRPEIPDGVDDRRRREMNHTLLRAEPSELAVRSKTAPEPSHVGANPIEVLPYDERCEGTDCSNADLVPTARREREPVTFESVVAVGAQRHVGGRVVRVNVQRVRTMQPPRSRKSNVSGVEADDGGAAQGCVRDTIRPI